MSSLVFSWPCLGVGKLRRRAAEADAAAAGFKLGVCDLDEIDLDEAGRLLIEFGGRAYMIEVELDSLPSKTGTGEATQGNNLLKKCLRRQLRRDT